MFAVYNIGQCDNSLPTVVVDPIVNENANVNVDLYSAQSHSASNALNAPGIVETQTSLSCVGMWHCVEVRISQVVRQ